MKSLTISRGTIEYTEHGRGTPVVFVHGLLVNHRLWDGVTEHLSATHRCITPIWPLGSHVVPMNADADLSPHGVAAIVGEFLEALDLEDVILVGNDSGGAVSQLVAAHHRERLAGLVLTNCDMLEVFPPKGFEYLAWLPRIPGLMWAMAKMMASFRALPQLKMAFGDVTNVPMDDALLHEWILPASRDSRIRRDAAKFIRGANPSVTQQVAKDLHDFDRPVVLAWGEDDTYFTRELAERFAAVLPNAKLQPIANARTFSPIDQPERIAEIIAELAGDLRENHGARLLSVGS